MKESILIFDGTFYGFLCGVSTAWKEALDPLYFLPSDSHFHPIDFFLPQRIITTSEYTAQDVINYLYQDEDRRFLSKVLRVFSVNQNDIYRLIFRYLSLRYQKVSEYLWSQNQDQIKYQFWQYYQKVSRELHRYKGLLRFEETSEGILWAIYQPCFHITGELAIFFHDRMPSESFAITDIGRKITVLYDQDDFYLLCSDQLPLSSPTPNQHLYASLWKIYFYTLSIEERRNHALHRQLLPKKYWPYLTEKKP